MCDAETRAMLRTVLDEVCKNVGEDENAVRAHVAAKILTAAGREFTVDDIREAGREALKMDPTMWR